MALEILSFDPGQTTGFITLRWSPGGKFSDGGGVDLYTLSSIYGQVTLGSPDETEVCFEDWRTFPGGPPYSKVVAKEVIGVIKIACIHAGLGWREYMPATKSLIQDKHLKALNLWHSSKHIRDATKIALVHLHKQHRELFDQIMKEVLCS